MKSEGEAKVFNHASESNALHIEARQYDLLPIHDTRMLANSAHSANASLHGLHMDVRPFQSTYHGKSRSGLLGKKLPQLYGREGTSTLYRLVKPKTMEVPGRLGRQERDRCVTELGEANQYLVYGPEAPDENVEDPFYDIWHVEWCGFALSELAWANVICVSY